MIGTRFQVVLDFSSPEFFSRPFRLFPAPTNCPWVSEDGRGSDIRSSRWRGVHSLEVWVLVGDVVGDVKRNKQNGACWALIDKEEVLRIYCEFVHQRCLQKTLSVVSDKKNNMSTPVVQDRNDSTKGVNGKRES